jgi:hypothetical protein
MHSKRNVKAMLYIFLGLNAFAFLIDPFLGVIFLLMWPYYFRQNKEIIADEL